MLKRIAIYSLEHLKEFYDGCQIMPYEKPFRKNLNGIEVKVNSWRYMLFLHKGFKCFLCGKEASFIALEVSLNNYGFRNYDRLLFEGKIKGHFNIYGIDEEGKEILFTKDHIWPRSLRGKTALDNFQTSCCICNTKKGNNPNITLEEAIEKDLLKPDSNIENIKRELSFVLESDD